MTLNHEGTSINEVGGIIEAIDATIVLNDNLGDANYGTIDAIDHGTIYLNVADTNATQQGGNHGLIEVLSGGGFIVTGDFVNWTGANVAAGGALSQVDFTDGTAVINDGTITAADHGQVLFQDLSLATNAGRIEATSGGIIEFVDTTLDNNGGTISAADAGRFGPTLPSSDRRWHAIDRCRWRARDCQFERNKRRHHFGPAAE